jgi:hypothetical protein
VTAFEDYALRRIAEIERETGIDYSWNPKPKPARKAKKVRTPRTAPWEAAKAFKRVYGGR